MKKFFQKILKKFFKKFSKNFQKNFQKFLKKFLTILFLLSPSNFNLPLFLSSFTKIWHFQIPSSSSISILFILKTIHWWKLIFEFFELFFLSNSISTLNFSFFAVKIIATFLSIECHVFACIDHFGLFFSFKMGSGVPSWVNLILNITRVLWLHSTLEMFCKD